MKSLVSLVIIVLVSFACANPPKIPAKTNCDCNTLCAPFTDKTYQSKTAPYLTSLPDCIRDCRSSYNNRCPSDSKVFTVKCKNVFYNVQYDVSGSAALQLHFMFVGGLPKNCSEFIKYLETIQSVEIQKRLGEAKTLLSTSRPNTLEVQSETFEHTTLDVQDLEREVNEVLDDLKNY